MSPGTGGVLHHLEDAATLSGLVVQIGVSETQAVEARLPRLAMFVLEASDAIGVWYAIFAVIRGRFAEEVLSAVFISVANEFDGTNLTT